MTSKAKKIAGMSREEKLRYFCGGRVTIGKISQVHEKTIKVSYVAKIRGVIVGNADGFRHETPEAARQYGKDVMAKWKQELTAVAGRKPERKEPVR